MTSTKDGSATADLGALGPAIVIDSSRGGWWSRLAEAFGRGELLWMLVRRDVAVRYREALLGVAWALLVPAATLGVYWLVFEVIFNRAAADVPFVLFLFPAMLIWNYFNSSVGRAAHSLARDSALLGKVYFPRILLPIANVMSPLLDAAIGLLVLFVILVAYKHLPGIEILWLPVFVGMGMLAATGVGMIFASFNAQFKDVQHFLPVMLHLWFFGSPVLYSTTLVPERFQTLYGLNPMVTVCEGVRYAVLGTAWPLSWQTVAASIAATMVAIVIGLATFMRTEQTITDVL